MVSDRAKRGCNAGATRILGKIRPNGNIQKCKDHAKREREKEKRHLLVTTYQRISNEIHANKAELGAFDVAQNHTYKPHTMFDHLQTVEIDRFSKLFSQRTHKKKLIMPCQYKPLWVSGLYL